MQWSHLNTALSKRTNPGSCTSCAPDAFLYLWRWFWQLLPRPPFSPLRHSPFPVTPYASPVAQRRTGHVGWWWWGGHCCGGLGSGPSSAERCELSSEACGGCSLLRGPEGLTSALTPLGARSSSPVVWALGFKLSSADYGWNFCISFLSRKWE